MQEQKKPGERRPEQKPTVGTYSDEYDRPESLDEIVNDIIADIDDEYKCFLYKILDERQNGKKVCCRTYINEIPNMHEVACDFGGGDYMVIVNGRNKKSRAKRFTLHENFARKTTTINGGAVTQQFDSLGSLETAFSIFDRVAGMMERMSGGKPQQPAEIANSISEIYKGVNKVLSDSISDNARFLRDSQEQILRQAYHRLDEDQDEIDAENNGENETDAEDQAPPPAGNIPPLPVEPSTVETVIQLVAPLLDEFLPKIIGEGPVSTAIITGIKMHPLFKTMQKKPDEVQTFVNFMVDKYGIEKAQAAAGALGIVVE
jgi:hypothetical protein